MLSDGDLIRNLLAEYCDLVDSGDLDGVGMLMADTGRYVDVTHHMEIEL